METVSFDSQGTRCEAWYLSASSNALTSTAGRPCVLMGHGFGATRDAGLLPFAERFAAAGTDVLVFDYRGFGTSEGTPRQDVTPRRVARGPRSLSAGTELLEALRQGFKEIERVSGSAAVIWAGPGQPAPDPLQLGPRPAG